MRPLICVVHDPYSITEAGGSFVVGTASDLSYARKIIEDIKAGQPSVELPWEVTVRRKSLLSGLQDILVWERSLVAFRDASPRAVIEKELGFSLPLDITNEHLISWDLRSQSDLPRDVGTDTDLDWLLDVALENVSGSTIWFSVSMTNEDWLADWFRYLLEGSTERLCSDRYLMQVVQNRVRQWLGIHLDKVPADLAELLLHTMSSGNGGQAVRQLVARALVREYGPGYVKLLVSNLPSDLVGVWISKKLSARTQYTLKRLSAQLYEEGRLSTLVEELDKLVGRELDGLNQEDELDRYIGLMSGFFSSEYREVVHRFCSDLTARFGHDDFDSDLYLATLSRIRVKFSPLLTKTAASTIDCQTWLLALLTLARKLRSLAMAQPSTPDEWRRVCTLLMRCEQVLSETQRDCPATLTCTLGRLENRFVELNRALNNSYSDWLLCRFPAYLDDPGLAKLVTQALLLADEALGAVIILVVDGLRWDWWQHLLEHLGEADYQLQSSDSVAFAMLPTVTNVSRRAALGRFPLSDLVDFVDDVYGIDVDPDEEALLAARVLGYASQLQRIKPTSNRRIRYLPKHYVYVNGSTDDIKEALKLRARHYVIVYSSIDRAAHNIGGEEVLEKTVLTSLRLLGKTLVDTISETQHLDPSALTLIVTADHGCAHTRWSEQRSLPIALKPYTEPDPHIERHGRVAQIIMARSAEAELVRLQVETFYRENEEEWHVIWGEEAPRYGLPRGDKKGNQVIAWLSPRNMNYLRKGTGLYVHGGFSLYETIVPLAVLGYSEEIRFTVPSLLLRGLDKLRKEQPSTISISIGNENNQEMTGVLSIPELQVEELEIEPVPSRDTASTELTVKPTFSGTVSLSLILRYRIGLSSELEIKKQFTVDVATSRRERMELETKRELF